METAQLTGVVLTIVVVGIILSIGIMIFDKFGDAVKTSTLTNESVTVASRTFTTTNDEITKVTQLQNATSTATCTVFNAPDACANWTAAGVVTVSASGNSYANITDGTGWYFVYTFDADSKATDVMDDMTSTTSTISSTWLSMIIIVIVASLILVLVMDSFRQRK